MVALPLAVRRLPHGADLPLPAYQSAGAAGLDLYAAIDAEAPICLDPGARERIPTGLAIALPAGFEAQIRARSGLALKHGIGVLNAPGTIDADYRGEISILLVNWGEAPFSVERGLRIAQMIIAPVARVDVQVVEELTPTDRGGAGFGSTGRDR